MVSTHPDNRRNSSDYTPAALAVALDHPVDLPTNDLGINGGDVKSPSTKAPIKMDTTTATTNTTEAARGRPAIPEPAPAPAVNVWLARKQVAATNTATTAATPADPSQAGDSKDIGPSLGTGNRSPSTAHDNKESVGVRPTSLLLDDPQSWPDPAAASAVSESKHARSDRPTAPSTPRNESATELSDLASVRRNKKKGKDKWVPFEADIKYVVSQDVSASDPRRGKGDRRPRASHQRGGERSGGSKTAGASQNGNTKISDGRRRYAKRSKSSDSQKQSFDLTVNGNDEATVSQEAQPSRTQDEDPATATNTVAAVAAVDVQKDGPRPKQQQQQQQSHHHHHHRRAGSRAGRGSHAGGRGDRKFRQGGSSGGGSSSSSNGGGGAGAAGYNRHHHHNHQQPSRSAGRHPYGQQQQQQQQQHHQQAGTGVPPYPAVTSVAAPMPAPLPQTEEESRKFIQKQVEYYFSVENLCKDVFFRTQMDTEGYVPLTLISGFNRVKMLTQDLDVVRQALEASEEVEMNEAKDKVRKRGDWSKWLFPKQELVKRHAEHLVMNKDSTS